MLKRDKHGTGHIEMLFGFTFFIGVVLFLFVIMKVGEVGANDESFLLEELEEKFIDKVGADAIKFYVYLNDTPTSCVSINLSGHGLDPDLNATVKSGGLTNPSGLSADILSVNATSKEFYVYLSKNFGYSTLDGCTPASASIGPFENQSLLSLDSVGLLKTDYDYEYESLKDDFGIGNRYDFAIVFANETFSMERSVSSNINVYSKESVLPFISSDGKIESIEVVFKIW